MFVFGKFPFKVWLSRGFKHYLIKLNFKPSFKPVFAIQNYFLQFVVAWTLNVA